MAGSTSVADLLDKRKKEANINSLQFTVSSSDKSMTVLETRKFVEMLDQRVYSNPRYLAWYCKAVRLLGKQKMTILQSMALDPSVKNSERLFAALVKQELEAAQA